MNRRIAKKIQKEIVRWFGVLQEQGAAVIHADGSVHFSPSRVRSSANVRFLYRNESLDPWYQRNGYFRPLRHEVGPIVRAWRRLGSTGWARLTASQLKEIASGPYWSLVLECGHLAFRRRYPIGSDKIAHHLVPVMVTMDKRPKKVRFEAPNRLRCWRCGKGTIA